MKLKLSLSIGFVLVITASLAFGRVQTSEVYELERARRMSGETGIGNTISLDPKYKSLTEDIVYPMLQEQEKVARNSYFEENRSDNTRSISPTSYGHSFRDVSATMHKSLTHVESIKKEEARIEEIRHRKENIQVVFNTR